MYNKDQECPVAEAKVKIRAPRTLEISEKENPLTEVRKKISMGLRLLRVGIDATLAIKSKNPLHVGNCMVSTFEAIDSVFSKNKKEKSLADILEKDHGLVRVFTHMEELVFSTMRQMRFERVETQGIGSRGTLLNTYNLMGMPLYAMTSEEDERRCYGMWAESQEKATEAFSKTLRETVDGHISMRVVRDEWAHIMLLMPTSDKPECYVPLDNENKYLESVRKFQTKGISRASLFWGPPGVGKTMFAARIADLMGTHMMAIESTALQTISSSDIPLKPLIDLVRPGVLLFDDMDRAGDIEGLLGEIQRLNALSSDLLIIGTVNDITTIPQAMRRTGRFDETVRFVLPTPDQRRLLLKAYMSIHGVRVFNGNIEKLVDKTDGMSRSDLREVALQCSILPVEEVISTKIDEIKTIAAIPDRSATLSQAEQDSLELQIKRIIENAGNGNGCSVAPPSDCSAV